MSLLNETRFILVREGRLLSLNFLSSYLRRDQVKVAEIAYVNDLRFVT